ncbi:MAG: CHC2 zinc finger domain-containing protein [Candidatus Omnitrophica bacterium]|nr:CHC2 zinc finger domain-containing protein [Candidatus Omnitrophota bacterium]
MEIKIEMKKILGDTLPPNEILKVFPQGREYITNKLTYLLNKRQQLLNRFKHFLKRQDLNLVELILIRDTFKERVKKINKEIRRLKRYLTSEIQDTHLEIDIRTIKERINIIDIFEELYPDAKLYKTSRTVYTNCPFHDDRHPSFHIYPKTCTFYCYGCGVKGDVVDLVKLSKGLTFKEAVFFLKNLIKGGRYEEEIFK